MNCGILKTVKKNLKNMNIWISAPTTGLLFNLTKDSALVAAFGNF